MQTLLHLLQTTVALGIVNVWLLRADLPTRYRGGDSQSLQAEFDAYGLPGWAFYAIGFLKLAAALGLLVGLWAPDLARASAGLMAALMIGALAMHVRIKDPLARSVPALTVLALSVLILVLPRA